MEQHTTNEKAGNNWKEKMEDAVALSAYGLHDKNAAWEKLYDHMHVPVKKKKAGWYWMAAACVVGLISGAFLLINKKQPAATVSNTTAIKAADDTKTMVQQNNAVPVKEEEKQVVMPVATVTKAPAKKQLKKIVAEPIASVEVKKEDSVLITASHIPPIHITAPVSLTVNNTPEKKKLKVVHVNELGTPLPELRSRVANDDYSVIQFNILNQQFFNTVPVVPAEKVNTSSKRKNIPN